MFEPGKPCPPATEAEQQKHVATVSMEMALTVLNYNQKVVDAARVEALAVGGDPHLEQVTAIVSKFTVAQAAAARDALNALGDLRLSLISDSVKRAELERTRPPLLDPQTLYNDAFGKVSAELREKLS